MLSSRPKIHIVIIIKNNVVANVDINNLHTTKRERGKHGFGIASIKQLVEKYEGDVAFTCENLIFETRIMLRNCND
ncbi:MAG: GHKL domain-containing protein [Eubacteriales bacterium]